MTDECLTAMLFKVDKYARAFYRLRPNSTIQAKSLFKMFWQRIDSH